MAWKDPKKQETKRRTSTDALEKACLVKRINTYVYAQIQHLGEANAMATLREEWWIPRLGTLVKKKYETATSVRC